MSLASAYLLQLLETGRRHVGVPPDLRTARRRESASERANLTAGGAEPGIAVPSLERLQDRHVQQRVRGLLRHDRLVPRGDLSTADATPPGRLEKKKTGEGRFFTLVSASRTKLPTLAPNINVCAGGKLLFSKNYGNIFVHNRDTPYIPALCLNLSCCSVSRTIYIYKNFTFFNV